MSRKGFDFKTRAGHSFLKRKLEAQLKIKFYCGSSLMNRVINSDVIPL